MTGNTYYCIKGCAGVSGGKIQESDKYCCNRNFKLCKDNCKSASKRQDHIERCEYGCMFWNKNPMYSGRCGNL